jgi:hypothetical protein
MGGRCGSCAGALAHCRHSVTLVLLLLPLTSMSPSMVGSTPGGSGQREPGDANKPERVALFLRGASTNEEVSKVLADLNKIKQPNALYLPSRVQGGQMQSNAFVEASHSKKSSNSDFI